MPQTDESENLQKFTVYTYLSIYLSLCFHNFVSFCDWYIMHGMPRFFSFCVAEDCHVKWYETGCTIHEFI